jgi:hypothetical protein
MDRHVPAGLTRATLTARRASSSREVSGHDHETFYVRHRTPLVKAYCSNLKISTRTRYRPIAGIKVVLTRQRHGVDAEEPRGAGAPAARRGGPGLGRDGRGAAERAREFVLAGDTVGRNWRSERVGVAAGPGRAPTRGGEGEGGAVRRKPAVEGGEVNRLLQFLDMRCGFCSCYHSSCRRLQGEVGDGEHLREGQGGVWVEDGDAGGRGGAERPPATGTQRLG